MNLHNLTPAKYDICIAIVVINGVDTGKLGPQQLKYPAIIPPKPRLI